jgi:peptidoglycan/LPS O-acetylase OafA/YrhL
MGLAARLKTVTETLTGSASDHSQGYVAALDGLRGIAILLVIAAHGRVLGFRGGHLGVDLFFVLSGYLITETLLASRRRDGKIGFGEFYWRRAVRLVPALLFFCAVFWVFAAWWLPNQEQVREDVLAALTYVTNWIRALETGRPMYLGHTWSLAIEEQFYLLWPWMLATGIGLFRGRIGAGLASLAFALALTVGTWRAWLFQHGASIDRVYNGFDTRFDGLLVGCALALAAGASAIGGQVERLRKLASLSAWPALAGFAALVASEFRESDFMAWGGFTAAGILAAIMVLAAVFDPGGRFASALAFPPLVGIGRISYGLYIWHYPIIVVLKVVYQWPMFWVDVVGIPVAFAGALLSWWLVEIPSRRLRSATLNAHIPLRKLGLASLVTTVALMTFGAFHFFGATITEWISPDRPIEIVTYGPHETTIGVPFNAQPDGSSALWVKPSRATGGVLRIRFDGVLLETLDTGLVLTARVPATLLAAPRDLSIELADRDGVVRSKPVPFQIVAVRRP